MKIAFVHAESEFNEDFFEELRVSLPRHELLSWKLGKQPPATDFELAIVMGKFTRDEMSTQPKLRLIQTASAGYDGIDIDAASEMGIWVAYSPSGETGNAISVAEFAVLLLLGASRSLNQVVQPPRSTIEVPVLATALYGKTVCIVGLGTIGRLLAERLKPFGVILLATDDHPQEVPEGVKVFKNAQMKEALAEADYVVLCVRATAENENLINASVLKAMKKGAVFVNIARGSLVDEPALIEALESGQLAYAGLDVVKDEPVKPGNPLLALHQVLVTPHVAGTTDINLKGMIAYVTRVVEGFSKDKLPKALVNKPASPRVLFF